MIEITAGLICLVHEYIGHDENTGNYSSGQGSKCNRPSFITMGQCHEVFVTGSK
jgi:hypothetical protein